MHRTNAVILTATIVVGLFAGLSDPARAQAPATGVTAFEGARLIVGDGAAPIENATLVVDGTRILQAGRAAERSGVVASSAGPLSPARPRDSDGQRMKSASIRACTSATTCFWSGYTARRGFMATTLPACRGPVNRGIP